MQASLSGGVVGVKDVASRRINWSSLRPPMGLKRSSTPYAFAIALPLILSAGRGGATRAWAQSADPVEPILIDYEASAGCPTAEELFRQIGQRTSRARWALSGETARRFSVRVEAIDARFRGQLSLSDGSSREVEGATCDAVVNAMALITALAIDPKASTAPVEPPAGPTGPPSPAEPPAADGPPRWTEPWVVAPPPRVTGPTWPWPPLAQPLPALPRLSRGPHWVGAVGLQAGAVSAIAPGATFAVGAFGEARLEGAGLASPALRIGALLAPANVVESSGGTAKFRWISGQVTACPVRFEPMHGLQLFPCGGLELGALLIESVSPLGAQTSNRPWVAADLVGRAQWEVVPSFRLEAQVTGAVPFVQDEFFFEPNVTVHETPGLGVGAFAGAAVDFW